MLQVKTDASEDLANAVVDAILDMIAINNDCY